MEDRAEFLAPALMKLLPLLSVVFPFIPRGGIITSLSSGEDGVGEGEELKNR